MKYVMEESQPSVAAIAIWLVTKIFPRQVTNQEAIQNTEVFLSFPLMGHPLISQRWAARASSLLLIPLMKADTDWVDQWPWAFRKQNSVCA
jgi:hypothetical protein